MGGTVEGDPNTKVHTVAKIEEGFTGTVWYFTDNKTYEQANNYLLKIAYKGNKEDFNPISVLEGDFGEVIYQNRK